MLVESVGRTDQVSARTAEWEPLWLGQPGRCLYAGLHRPQGCGGVGVVLAGPLLAEQPRSRRLMFEIAGALVAQGLACLRFDYFGTAESEGEGECHDLDAMHADLDLAVAELRKRTKVARTVLMAWRGAALVASDWALRNAIDLLVLCDPIMDGAAWLAELEAADRRERVSPDRYPHGGGAEGPADGQLLGFPVSAAWRRGVAALRLAGTARGSRPPTWVVLRDPADTPEWASRTFILPPNIASFDADTRMDATLFLSPPLRALVGDLGKELKSLEP
jgi:hypothetical protein